MKPGTLLMTSTAALARRGNSSLTGKANEDTLIAARRQGYRDKRWTNALSGLHESGAGSAAAVFSRNRGRSFFTALEAATAPRFANASWFFSISFRSYRKLTMIP